ncbi:hypothetical protein KSP40_PGU012007 [Platanthera guangdongensis]|uniref:Uncharacterized protein n=1 Tax=Platanthera guangdongensis TaxID=2320717 RepID=A0ABR2N0D6_9ASPA
MRPLHQYRILHLPAAPPLPSKSGSHAAGGREKQPLFSSTDSAEIPSGNFMIRLRPSRAPSISTSRIWFSSVGRPASVTLE